MIKVLLVPLSLAAVAAGWQVSQSSPPPVAVPAAENQRADRDGFDAFVSADEVRDLAAAGAILIDARSPEEYATAHLPGAINLPGADLRTPSVSPGAGDSQYVFLDDAGSVDVARYEQIFGEAGLTETDDVIVYGNHAGKADGSVPAMLLDGLGHRGTIRFFDGIALSEWYKAGFEVETIANTLPATTYTAAPRDGFVWTLNDVLAHVDDRSAIFYDTRSAEEYSGSDLRKNARGGHIPGALHADYAELLNADKTVKTRDEIESILADQGLDQHKADGTPIVLYCQTSTRVSLPYLILRELGYENVHVYDASWHEYGNREDTPIEK